MAELTPAEANKLGATGVPVCLICNRRKQPRGGRQTWTGRRCNETCPGYEWAPEPPGAHQGGET